MTDGRVSRLSRHVLRDGDGRVRVAQIAREVLLDGGAPVHVAGINRQTVQAGDGRTQVAQVCRMVARSRRDSPYPNFPVRLFCPPALSVRLAGGTIIGGLSPADDVEIEAMDVGARWVMTFPESPLWTKDKVQTWRAFATGADLGAMNLVIPLWDRLYQPFTQAAYSGSSTFAGVVWRDTQVWEADAVQATTAAASAQYSTQVSFRFTGGALAGGEHFSLYRNRYGWRLYRLIRLTDQDGDVQTWEIRPPLREWVGADTPMNFDSPRCTMQAEGDISEVVELLRLGRGGATFVESFNRYP